MSVHGMFRDLIARTRHSYDVLGASIDAISWDEALDQIRDLAALNMSRYVCICNVHSVVSARQDASFANVLAGADMATPDGAPVAWMLRRYGAHSQQRINGPDLMWRYCALAAERKESIYLYGGSEETLRLLRVRLLAEFPGLHIAGHYSPPYRPLTPEEDEAVVERINASGAGTVWVSLGCPKQEQWMAAHRGRIHAVMIGVGAAFDYHAGTLQRAPMWMQQNGLEWLYRLCKEPRRLWRRYVYTNTLFMLAVAEQMVFGTKPAATPRTVIMPTLPEQQLPGLVGIPAELLRIEPAVQMQFVASSASLQQAAAHPVEDREQRITQLA